MDYAAALEWVASLQVHGWQLGLERFGELCRRLGSPQRSFRSVHVAGTKGKGSTTRLAAAVLEAMDFRTGSYFSPYVFDVRERIQVNGTPISCEAFAAAASTVRTEVEAVALTPLGWTTEFEAKTAMAFVHFDSESVDWACVEVGLGGRLDATNVVVPECSVITNIGLDHTQILGDTTRAIATEKAGIIKHGIPVVTAATDTDALDVIRATAAAAEAPLTEVRDASGAARLACGTAAYETQQSDQECGWVTVRTPSRTYERLAVGMPGRYQRVNASTAVVAVEQGLARTHLALDAAAVRAGLASAELPGRFSRYRLPRGGELVLDGAHNGLAGAALAALLHDHIRRNGYRTVTLVVGMLDGHAPGDFLAPLGEVATRLIVCAPHWRRALPVEDMVRAAADLGMTAEAYDGVAAAVAAAVSQSGPSGLVVVTGSFYTIGEVDAEYRAAPIRVGG